MWWWGDGEHNVCGELERTGFVWSVPDKWGEEITVVFSDLTGGCREEGVRCFSQVHSDRVRSNRDKLRHRKFWLDVWKGILPLGWWDIWTDCLNKLGNLHPWRLSKLHWVRPWATWSSWTRFEWEAELEWSSEIPSNLHNSLVLWMD